MNKATDVPALLDAEKLDEAISVMNGEVRSQPTSVDMRAMLAELLCISGNLERADTVLDAISDLDPTTTVGVALFRQLVRAEQARQQFYSEGRVPEFITKPNALVELELRAAVALRDGSREEAGGLLAERETLRTPVAGSADGVAFEDFRDHDDLSAGHIEVLTPNGKYFWVPVSSITAIEFRKPERRRDLLWRRANLSVTEGPDGEVFVPSIYVSPDATPAQRLGHTTDYDGEGSGPVLARGLRMFFLGEESKSILDLGHLEFTPSAA